MSTFSIPEGPDTSLAVVAMVASRTEAELAAGLLRSHGLHAAVAADDAGGQQPQWQIDGVRVLAGRSDEAEARRLLNSAEPAPNPNSGGNVASGRPRLPRTAASWTLATLLGLLFFASAAASPLYRVYQSEFHFSATTLTAVFATYVLFLLVTLLVGGSLSNYLGRLPVIVVSLALSAGACLVFVMAHDVGALYAARAVQGVATGLASGAIGAALIDLQPPGSQRASVVTSAFPTLGLALGALITSALVQYAPAPMHLIWWALLGVFVAGLAATFAMAEPGTKRRGALASLRPTIAVPHRARGTFAAAVPCFVAGWALGGLYLSLGPSLAAEATRSRNLLWGGLVIFLLAGVGGGSVLLFRSISSRAAMLAGCLFLLAGMAVTFGAIATTTSAPFLAGSAIAGVGFGLTFLGSFRMTMSTATPEESAGLLSAIFIVAYLAFAIPALIAGVAATTYGLHSTALVYSAALAAIAAVAVVVLLLRPTGKPAEPIPAAGAMLPPGPCTCPPCLQLAEQTHSRAGVAATSVGQSQTRDAGH